MDIRIRKTIDIKSINEWRDYASPQSSDQWKNGRSSKLLAQYVLNPSFSKDIEQILKNLGLKSSDVLFGEPEALTNLPPEGSRGPRHHDLLLKDDKTVIGIESKVGESFGNNNIKEEYTGSYSSKIKRQRIEELCKILNPKLSVSDFYPFGYQLLTGSVGTILEAKETLNKIRTERRSKNSIDALFLILTFTGNVELRKGEDVSVNREDYLNFRKRIFDKDNDGFMKQICFEKTPNESVNFYMRYQEINVPKEFNIV